MTKNTMVNDRETRYLLMLKVKKRMVFRFVPFLLNILVVTTKVSPPPWAAENTNLIYIGSVKKISMLRLN
jgi:hypothetical protein